MIINNFGNYDSLMEQFALFRRSKLPSFSVNIRSASEFKKNLEYQLRKNETIGNFTFFEKFNDQYIISFNQSYVFLNNDFSQADLYLTEDNTEQNEFIVSYLLMQGYMFRLVVNNSLLVHSAAVIYKDCGILFCGKSGAGKSTQANLWKNYLGAWVLNYDKPCILKENNSYLVHGTPWSGKEALFINKYAPLKAIVFVNKSKENKVERLSFAESFGELFLHNYVYAIDKITEEKYVDTINSIVERIPVYNLYCDISINSVSVLYSELFNSKPSFRKDKTMKYKVKSNFKMIRIADDYIVIPRGNTALNYNATVVFNDTGVYLWNLLQDFCDIDYLASKLADKYSVDIGQTTDDVKAFIERINSEGMLEIMNEEQLL